MFYEGDLQSGIATALRERKLVACFVKGDDPESEVWEREFFRDERVRRPFETRSILLRLQAGSEEANFLDAIVPVWLVPTLVIIESNGKLKEYISAGEDQDVFCRWARPALLDYPAPDYECDPHHHSILLQLEKKMELRAALRTAAENERQRRANEAHEAAENERQRSSRAITQASTSSSSITHSPLPPTTNLQNDNATTSQDQPESSASAVQRQLADRKDRLETEKKKREEAEKAQRAAKAKARQEELKKEVPADSQKAAELTYAQQQKKRQREARAERERILKRVEDDKIERKKREEQRKAQLAQAQVQTQAGESSTTPSFSRMPTSSSRNFAECALLVRLFDGATIRSRFPSKATLRNEVRSWIREKQSPEYVDTPYTFKLVLSPQENRSIGDSEEEESLASIGLVPNATLVLTPIKDFTNAYDNRGASYASWAGAAGYGAISSLTNMVSGVVGSIFGGSQSTQDAAQGQQPQSGQSNEPAQSARVRTMRDGQREDHQLYNGNALNFEPRPDDDKEE